MAVDASEMPRMNAFSYMLVTAASFLLGSIPTGYIAAKACGVDIRNRGSGNVGATNVTRTLNPWAGRIVFAMDLLKGLIPTLAAPRLFPHLDYMAAGMIACFCTILGHNYTPWLGFKGGKGIAAAMGGFMALCWPAQVIAWAVWLSVFFLSRYVSLASIVSALSIPFLTCVFERDWRLTGFAIAVAALTLERHRDNIKRLRTGSEYKFAAKGRQ
jgi:acyl phosphate:glycerol-3-phosphate acyltransferase